MLSAPHRQLNRLCLTAILALALPALVTSSPVTGISANGTCGSGTCTAAGLATGALTIGSSTSGSYNFDVHEGDGDVYDVSGTFEDTFLAGTFLGFYPTVTLISGTAAGADTITLDLLQDFANGNSSTSWAGPYNEKIPF